MNKLMELVLSHRGLTAEDLEGFENPEHADLQGIDHLVERLHDINEKQSKIVIIPDFDMDGIMSGVVGYAGMSELGFNVALFCPNPQEGYGFGRVQIKRIIGEHPDVKAIISCDCGISCAEGAAAADEHGIEVLITDHHIENAETSPREIASALVDPCAIGETYEHPAICGAHVLWQCLAKYAEQHAPGKVAKIDQLRVFAGIGTISDIMPVLYENRILVRDAIRILKSVWSCSDDFTSSLSDASEPYKQAFRGLYAAYKVFSEENKVKDIDGIDEQFFGFYMAPAFNSVKRMDGEMSRAFGVFKDKTQTDDMRYLFALNEERKKVVAKKSTEMMRQDQPLAPFCYITDAQKGILGLLATNAVKETGMPCVVVRENGGGSYSGSGRSPEWFPYITIVGGAGYRVAGHEGAFGCGFDSREQLEEVCKLVENTVEELPVVLADPEDEVDFIIDPSGNGDTVIDETAFIEFVEQLDSYRPFGRGFEQPKAMLRFDAGSAGWQMIGSNQNHLKITLLQGLDVLCWNQAKVMEDGIPMGTIRITGNLEVNEFRGKKSAQFVGDILQS